MKILKLAGGCILTAALMTSPQLYADGHKSHAMQASAHDHHKGHSMQAMENDQQAVTATGVVKEIVSGTNKVKIYHQPIEAWNMGAMQMTFELGADVDVSQLEVGQSIKFKATSPSTGRFVITQILED